MGGSRTHHEPGGAILLLKGPTPAEARVLELAASGLSTAQIAQRLWVTPSAVTFHIGNLLHKLGVGNRAGAIARAYALGLLDAGAWPPRVNPLAIVDERRPDHRGRLLPFPLRHAGSTSS
jgi:DNA-binding CsgD family transcriptional regulator